MATPTNLPAVEVDGTSLPAAWLNDLRGAFRILQVVHAATTTVIVNSTTSFIDSGLTASITPQSSTSKILVLVQQQFYVPTGGDGLIVALLRGSTTLQSADSGVFALSSAIVGDRNFFYLDSPASTSSVTYKTQFRRGNASGGALYAQINTNPSNIVLLEVSA